jgi:talin
MHTTEGNAITSLIAGYIDIMAEHRGIFTSPRDDLDETQMLEASAVTTGTSTLSTLIMESKGSAFPRTQQLSIDGLSSTIRALQTLSSELQLGLESFSASHTLTSDQWSDQLTAYLKSFDVEMQKLLSLVRSDPEKFDRNKADKIARSLNAQMLGLSITAKNIAAITGNKSLLDGARNISDAVSNLLSLIEKAAPGMDVQRFLNQLAEAEKAVSAASVALEQERLQHFADKGFEVLMMECIADVNAGVETLVDTATDAAPTLLDVGVREKLEDEASNTRATCGWAVHTLNSLAPVMVDPKIQVLVEESTNSVTSAANRLVSTARGASIDKKYQNKIDKTLKRLNLSIKLLLDVRAIVETRGAEGEVDLETPASLLLAALAQVRKNIDVPNDLVTPTRNAVNATNLIVRDTKTLADVSDEATQDRLMKAAKNIGDTMNALLENTKVYFKDTMNMHAKGDILENASKLEAYCQDILTDAGVTAALTALRFTTKVSVARSIKLLTLSLNAYEGIKDKETKAKLDAIAASISDNINAMIVALNPAAKKPNDIVVQKRLMATVKTSLPAFHSFLGDIRALKKLGRSADEKANISGAADSLAEALGRLEKACKTVGNIGSMNEIEEALEDFVAIQVDLDAAMFAADQGLLTALPGQTRENALEMLSLAARSLAKTLQLMTDAARKSKQLSNHVRDSAAASTELTAAVRVMASTVADRPTQRRIVTSAKNVTTGTLVLVSSCRVLVVDIKNEEKIKTVDVDHAKVRSELATLLAAAKGLDARECDEAIAVFTVESAKLTSNMPTAVTFKTSSDSLVAIAKAMAAAISQLVGSARSNPRGVGSAAKITSVTLTQLVQAINAAASTADDQVSKDLLAASKTFIQKLTDLMQTVKRVAASRDAESMGQLDADHRAVTEALQAILAALGNASSPEVDDAIRLIMEAVQNLDNMDGVDGKGRSEVLDSFSDVYQSLTAIIHNLILSSRDPSKMGVFSKEAAATIEALINSARAASKNAGSPIASPVSTAIQDLIKCCEYVLKYPTEEQKVAGVTKKATQCCSLLVNLCKQMALKLTAPEDKPKQQAILRAAKAIAQGGSHLAECAATMKLPALTDAAKALMGFAKDLEEASSDGNHIDNSSAQRLSASSRTVGVGVADVIRAAALVSSSKKEAAPELRKAHATLQDALNTMAAVVRSLNPGILECQRAEDKTQASSTEMDALSLELATGTAKLTNPGKAHAEVQEDYVAALKALGADIAAFTTAASSGSVDDLVKTAKAVQKAIATVEAVTRNAVATSITPQAQQLYLTHTKNVLDKTLAVIRAGKETDPTDDESIEPLLVVSESAAKTIGAIIASLQSNVALVSDIEKVIATVSADGKLLSSKLEQSLVRKRYGQYKEDASNLATKQLATLVQSLSMASPDNLGQLGLQAKRIGDSFPTLVAAVRGAATATTDATASRDILASSKAFSDIVLHVLEQAKTFAKDSQSPVAMQKLRASSQTLPAEAAKLVDALRRGAVGEILCENAIASIQTSVGQINTSSIFAQAGQLEVERTVAATPLTKLQDSLVASANEVANLSKSVADASQKGQDAVGQSATGFAQKMAVLATAATNFASRIQDPSVQQEILSSAKFVGIRSQQLVLVSKEKEAVANQTAADASVAQAHESVIGAANTLSNAAQRATSSADAGNRELDNARKSILALLQGVPGYDSASFDDVIKATKDVAAAVAGLVFAGTPQEISAACQKAVVSTDALLNAAKTAARTCADAATAKAIVECSQAAGRAMVDLIDVCKLNRSDADTQSKREDSSGRVSKALADIVNAIRSMPDVVIEVEEVDLENVANDELMKAAKIIEEAAALLARARPVRTSKDPSVVDEASLTDAILDAAQAIAAATSGLIAAATAAQNERVKNKMVNPTSEKYHNDPTWANGLISSAKGVASAVRYLVIAANNAAQGKADQEVLIVSARTVAASTVQLVAACRAKADPLSRTQQALSEAAKAVSDATNRLVRAAQKAADYKETNSDVSETSGYASSTQQKYSQQIKVMQLEAQIKAERERLSKMNKADYGK